MKKAHAKHNEELCDFLLTNGKYNDWVITTAFYSAIHYVQYEIFPFTEQGKHFNTFEQYYKYKSSSSQKTFCKHRETANLVCEKMPRVYTSYRWLRDECKNARYTSYQISPNYAQKAREYLTEIIYDCKKK